MATKHLRRLVLAFLILTGAAQSLQAQSAGYFINTESGETRFIQRLAWTGGEYALRYEVVIEREVDGIEEASDEIESEVDRTRIIYLREFTETPFIEVSLPPGNYRFQITSYNILDKIEDVSQWENIEVRLAVQPEVSDVSLELVSGSNNDGTSGYVLNISGENFSPDTEFIILNSEGTQIIPEVITSGEDGNASLFIESGAFTPGEYELVIQNPGGLKANIGGIVFPQIEESEDIVKNEPEDEDETVVESEPKDKDETAVESKPEDEEEILTEEQPKQPRTFLFLAGASWAPVFPVHGNFYGTSPSFAGAGIHFGAAFPTPLGFHIGAELSTFWNLSNNTINDDFSNVMSLGANLLLMKWLPTPNQPMALTFRLGLSYVIIPEIQDKIIINTGASYLWRFTNIFTLEAGLDYAALIRENSFDGCLRPWIGIGVIF